MVCLFNIVCVLSFNWCFYGPQFVGYSVLCRILISNQKFQYASSVFYRKGNDHIYYLLLCVYWCILSGQDLEEKIKSPIASARAMQTIITQSCRWLIFLAWQVKFLHLPTSWLDSYDVCLHLQTRNINRNLYVCDLDEMQIQIMDIYLSWCL